MIVYSLIIITLLIAFGLKSIEENHRYFSIKEYKLLIIITDNNYT